MDRIVFFVCLYHIVLSVSCSLVVTCWERPDLLACHCPIRYPASGVVLDCMIVSIPDICLLPYFQGGRL